MKSLLPLLSVAAVAVYGALLVAAANRDKTSTLAVRFQPPYGLPGLFTR
jgi:hypothetical protein